MDRFMGTRKNKEVSDAGEEAVDAAAEEVQPVAPSEDSASEVDESEEDSKRREFDAFLANR